MLPDIRTLKNELLELVHDYIRAESHRKLGAFAMSPVHIIHEGNCMKTIRADGSSDISELKSAGGEVSIPFDKVGHLTAQERVDILEKLTDEMARQMSLHFYGAIDRTLEATGQVVSSATLSPVEGIFAAFEKVQLDFDEQGNIKDFVISAGSAAVEGLRKAQQQIESDPILAQRWGALMEKKREEWRAREAARKLVG